MKKLLSFSNDFFKAYFYQGENSFKLDKYGILINISSSPISFNDGDRCGSLKSYLFKNITMISEIKKAILITFEFDPMKPNAKLSFFCQNNWDNNKIRYPKNPEKWYYKTLRSPIDRIGNYEFNCWYLPIGETSSLHREHTFKEVHTQIFGLGIMGKYQNDTSGSLYQEVYMTPGFTHDPFFDSKNIYPWHQYKALSDCIWLGLVKH